MSHEIVYDRRFIKTSAGFVPMILSGSSNCTEPIWGGNGRVYERRERHWWAFTPRSHKTPIISEEKYLEYVQPRADEQPDGELFVQHGKWVHTKQWPAWVKRGCKDAKTLEEYLSQNPVVSFEAQIRIYDSKNDYPGVERLRQYLHTSEEIVQWVFEAEKERAKILAEADDPKTSVVMHMAFTGKEPLKVFSALEGPVIVRNKGGYLMSYETGKRISFTPDIATAVVFDSVEDARAKIGYGWQNIRFMKAPKDMKLRVYAIRILSGRREGCYVGRKTRATLDVPLNIERAQKFSSVKAAEQYMRKTACRFLSIGKRFEVLSIEDPAFSHKFTLEAEV